MIELVSVQESDEGTEKTEFTTSGEFYEKNGIFYITYKEHSDMGMGDSRVFIRVGKDAVTIRRIGEFNGVMCYETGKITECIYRTPFGNLNIHISTSSMDSKLSEKGGSLRISYTLSISEESTENDILLKVAAGEERL